MRRAAGATPEALLQVLAEGLLIALLAFAPWAFGGVPVWSSSLIQAGAVILLASWVCRWLVSRPLRRSGGELWKGDGGGRPATRTESIRPAAIPAAALIGLALLQLIPVPRRAIRLISPAAAERFAVALPGYADGSPGGFDRLEIWLTGEDRGLVKALESGPPGASPLMSRPLSLDPSGTLGALLHLSAATAVFVVATGVMRRRQAAERAAWVVALTGVGVSVLGVVQGLQWNGRIYWFYPASWGSPYGPFLERDQFGAYAVLAATLAFGLLAGRLVALRGLEEGSSVLPVARWLRGRPDAVARLGLSAFAVLVILAGLVHSGSRTAPLCLALSAAILGAIKWARRRPALAAACAATGAGGVAAAAVLVASGSVDLTTRVNAWRSELSLATLYPVVGTGLGTVPTLAPAAARGGSEALRLAAETGAAGLLIAGWGLARLARSRPLRRPEDGAPASLLAGSAAVGLLAVMLMALADAGFLAPAVTLSCAVVSAMMVAQAGRRDPPAVESI